MVRRRANLICFVGSDKVVQFHIINIQRRLANYHWSKAETWEQAKAIHAQWMSDHNYQDHWAHKDRVDGRLSPAEVLGWVRGTVWEPERVHRVFFSHQFKRWLDRFGCVRFRHFRLFGEEGLARENITLWHDARDAHAGVSQHSADAISRLLSARSEALQRGGLSSTV